MRRPEGWDSEEKSAAEQRLQARAEARASVRRSELGRAHAAADRRGSKMIDATESALRRPSMLPAPSGKKPNLDA